MAHGTYRIRMIGECAGGVGGEGEWEEAKRAKGLFLWAERRI